MKTEMLNILFSKVNVLSLSALAGVHSFSGVIASIDQFCANITHIASVAVIASVLAYNILKIIHFKKDKT
jgi:hypothetical protein